MINIHPSLLPLYAGLHTHRRALADGARMHGCTVHFVTPDVDGGPIIAQGAVAVLPATTRRAWPRACSRTEHRLLPAAVNLFCEGRLVIADAGGTRRDRAAAVQSDAVASRGAPTHVQRDCPGTSP